MGKWFCDKPDALNRLWCGILEIALNHAQRCYSTCVPGAGRIIAERPFRRAIPFSGTVKLPESGSWSHSSHQDGRNPRMIDEDIKRSFEDQNRLAYSAQSSHTILVIGGACALAEPKDGR